MYKGTAKLADGQTLEICGTIQECANWADNIIRANQGEIIINIREVTP